MRLQYRKASDPLLIEMLFIRLICPKWNSSAEHWKFPTCRKQGVKYKVSPCMKGASPSFRKSWSHKHFLFVSWSKGTQTTTDYLFWDLKFKNFKRLPLVALWSHQHAKLPNAASSICFMFRSYVCMILPECWKSYWAPGLYSAYIKLDKVELPHN